MDHLCYILCGEAARSYGKRDKVSGTNSKENVLSDPDSKEEESDADLVHEADDSEKAMFGTKQKVGFLPKTFVFDFECGFDTNQYHCPNMIAVICLDDDSVSMTFCGRNSAENYWNSCSQTTEP